MVRLFNVPLRDQKKDQRKKDAVNCTFSNVSVLLYQTTPQHISGNCLKNWVGNIISVFLLLILMGCNNTFTNAASTPTAVINQREIVVNDLDFEVMLQFSDIELEADTPIFINNNLIYLMLVRRPDISGISLRKRAGGRSVEEWVTEEKGVILSALDPKTQSIITISKKLLRPEAFSLYQDILYIGLYTKLQAYDLQSNQLLWSREDVLKDRTRTHLYSQENTLFVNASRFDELQYYQLNAKTGNILQRITPIGECNPDFFCEHVLAIRDDLVYTFSPGRRYRSQMFCQSDFPSGSNKSCWQGVSLPDFPDLVALTDTTAIIAGKQSLNAYNLFDGTPIWEHMRDTNLMSSWALINNTAYFLQGSNELAALDLTTGEITGRIQFTHSLDSNWYDLHQVAVGEKHLVIYFADSKQLFILKKIDNVP